MICEWCGKTYKVKQFRKKVSRFCSRRCRYEWQKENLVGEDNPHWKGGYDELKDMSWKMAKLRVRRRDHHTCQICGKNKEEMGCEPDVHHIIPLTEGGTNKPSNLIMLCRKCHMHVEGEKAFIPLLFSLLS